MNRSPYLKINVFQLPSQTTVMFFLILGVVLGGFLYGTLSSGPVCLWPLGVALPFLALRSYLTIPEKMSRRYGLRLAGEEYAQLKEAIDSLSAEMGLARNPTLWIRPLETEDGKGKKKISLFRERKPFPVTTFGTWRRWYIAMDGDEAQLWQNRLMDTVERPRTQASIAHELAHFRNQDHMKLGITEALLRYLIFIALWGLIFFTSYIILLIVVRDEFVAIDVPDLARDLSVASGWPEGEPYIAPLFDQMQLQAAQEKATGLGLDLAISYVIMTISPYVFISWLIWGIYYRKLWRLREYYADAGALLMMKVVRPVEEAIFNLSLASIAPQIPDEPKKPHLFDRLSRLVKYHPDIVDRQFRLYHPERVFDDWQDTALVTGSLALVLNVLLSNPATLLVVGSWPLHFFTLAMMIFISFNYLLPTLAIGISWRTIVVNVLKIIGISLAIYFGWLILMLALFWVMFFMTPAFLQEMLGGVLAATARYGGLDRSILLVDINDFVLEATWINLRDAMVIALALVAGMFAITWLLRRILSWYIYQSQEQMLVRIMAWGVMWIAGVWGLLLLPVLEIILEPVRLTQTGMWAMLVLGAIVLLAGSLGFIRFRDRNAGKCPRCGQEIRVAFFPGQRCESCELLMFPWLLQVESIA